MSGDASGPAYTSIVGSGPNAVVLHYSADNRQIQDGELVVMDAAAECSSYAADITRTLPANGRFSPAAAASYTMSYSRSAGCHSGGKAGRQSSAKRILPGSLMNIAFEYINTHGRDRNGDISGKYVLHGLSHHIGLDVHDPGDIMKPLRPGMVISIEPAYISVMKVSAFGSKTWCWLLNRDVGVLTRALPKDARVN